MLTREQIIWFNTKRILRKVARLILYGFVVYQINSHWNYMVENRMFFERCGCYAALFFIGIATLECIINILHRLFRLSDPEVTDLFIFLVLFIPLCMMSGIGKGGSAIGTSNNSFDGRYRGYLTSDEKMFLTDVFREKDLYEKTSHHTTWKK